jgi:hypothetical protein
MEFFMSIRAARPAYRRVMALVRARLPGAGGTQRFARAMRSQDAAGAMRAWLAGESYRRQGK